MTKPKAKARKSGTSLGPCSICGGSIELECNGWAGGHNAQPINSGRCCAICNDTVVIPVRIRQLYARRSQT